VRDLVKIAKRWEREHVIPHCAVCSKPCCKLETVVLDLEWPQVRELYKITSSKKQFDQNLPSYIRVQDGKYYAHGEQCPAYVDARCSVYEKRPTSCRDFPIYEDGDAITVDTRCEAIDVAEIEKALGNVTAVVDRDFPVLVSFISQAENEGVDC
jgi:Fe-S-cluster containining protein